MKSLYSDDDPYSSALCSAARQRTLERSALRSDAYRWRDNWHTWTSYSDKKPRDSSQTNNNNTTQFWTLAPWIPVKSVNFPLIFPGSLHRIPWVRPLRNSAGWHQGHSFIWSAARQLRASRPSVDVSFLLLTGCTEYVPSQSHLGALRGDFCQYLHICLALSHLST